MVIPFAKLQGLANDFIVVQGRSPRRSWPTLARAILDRHTGVGGDGLVVLLPPRKRPHAALARFFNADGSEAEMSGNGIRCAGAVLASLQQPKQRLEIETAAGVKSLALIRKAKGMWIFRVQMGAPILEPGRIPFISGTSSAPIVNFPLSTRRGNAKVTVTSMGNPHCTVFVRDFAALDWQGLGREIECSRQFPNRTNVEFVKVVSRREIAVRFWERGVGHTQSSGTGSCAAAVASILNGRADRRVRVRTEAGVLEVAWPQGGEVSLTGPVAQVARGYYFHAGSRR